VTRTLVVSAALALLVAGCTLSRTWEKGQARSEPVRSEHDVAPVRALVAFARAPSDATWSAVPLADEVSLGLGDKLLERRSAEDLRDPNAWKLNPRGFFRAYVGPFSALDLLAEPDRPLRVTLGRHDHCASPPMPAPRKVAALERISVQPRRWRSCLEWFTVDAFVTRKGEIRAVTLDLWEP
jgi:hypothetical protein